MISKTLQAISCTKLDDLGLRTSSYRSKIIILLDYYNV